MMREFPAPWMRDAILLYLLSDVFRRACYFASPAVSDLNRRRDWSISACGVHALLQPWWISQEYNYYTPHWRLRSNNLRVKKRSEGHFGATVYSDSLRSGLPNLCILQEMRYVRAAAPLNKGRRPGAQKRADKVHEWCLMPPVIHISISFNNYRITEGCLWWLHSSICICWSKYIAINPHSNAIYWKSIPRKSKSSSHSWWVHTFSLPHSSVFHSLLVFTVLFWSSSVS